MGIRSVFKLAADVAQRTDVRTGASLSSPFTSSAAMHRMVVSDLVGSPELRAPSRLEAMQVPSVAKGRALICGTLSRQPLALFRGDEQLTPAPWMFRTNTSQAPQVRALWTLDDAIFYGSSLWAVERGSGGRILDAVRVPFEWWSVDPDSLGVLVGGHAVDASDVVLLEGPQEGLLELASDTIRAARAMDRAWSDRVQYPLPPTHLESTDPQADLEDDEAKALVKAWDAARRAGGSAYTPHGIKANYPSTTASDLYVAGRNALRLDIANFLNLPASLLEGSSAVASLTYSTSEGKRSELLDYSLSYWSTPLEARLSQDDVVPAGSRVAFDVAYLTDPAQPAQGPAHQD